MCPAPGQMTVILCVRRAATSQPGRIVANLFVRRLEINHVYDGFLNETNYRPSHGHRVIYGQTLYLAPDKMPTCFNKDDFRRCTLGLKQLPRIEAIVMIVEQQRSKRNRRPSPSAVKDTQASYPVDITFRPSVDIR